MGKECKNFEELKQNFREYGGDRAPLTRKRGGQLHALAVEAKKMGILPTSNLGLREMIRFK